MTRPSDVIPYDRPVTSGELAALLQNNGSSASAARQAIRRDKDLWRLPFRLPHRGRLFARKQQQFDALFFLGVATAIESQRPGLSRTIRALFGRRTLLAAEAERLLAAPRKQRASRTPIYATQVRSLVDLGVCRIEAEGTSLERLTLSPLAGSREVAGLATSSKARLLIEAQLTRLLADDMRRKNVIGWNSAQYPDASGSIRFSEYPFAAIAYCWLNPLMRQAKEQKPKPTPVLFDVHSRNCSVLDVEGFLQRISQVSLGSRTRLPILGVLAANDFEKGAWSLAKQRGLMLVSFRQSLGDEALRSLARVETLLKMVGSDSVAETDDTTGSLDSLADSLDALKVHPFVADLRSIGFEAVTALLIRSLGWEDVGLGVSVPFSDTTREVDVLGRRGGGRETLLIEAKAEHDVKELDPAYVRKFFTETVPAYLRSKDNIEQCHAQIWTTGTVGAAAKSALTAITFGSSGRVIPQLLSRAEILKLVPPVLEPCKRLIATISSVPA